MSAREPDGGESAPCPLDLAVEAAAEALSARGATAPRALFLLGTGLGMLPLRMRPAARASLAEIEGAPGAWRGAVLHSGELEGLPCWMLEDAPGRPEEGGAPDLGEPAWTRGFPCWLAARAGAAVLVHACAAVSLERETGEGLAPGTLALVSDHLNLSGRTPLIGLGASKLGPLFPAASTLHHEGLRRAALAEARRLGLPAAEAVLACAMGPALETPAERRYFARAGADVAAQGVAEPLLAAAHAGLRALAIACVTDRGEGPADIGAMLARAEGMAAGLEDLLVALAPGIARAAEELTVEG